MEERAEQFRTKCGFDCSAVDPSKLPADEAERRAVLKEGRMSFFSGHASVSFVAATYLALQVGGYWVWGDRATDASRPVGTMTMAALGGLASFVALSRTSLMDGVHHETDVLTGTLLGIGLANLFYWRHFGTDGRPRPHGDEAEGAEAPATSLTLSALGGGPALMGGFSF